MPNFTLYSGSDRFYPNLSGFGSSTNKKRAIKSKSRLECFLAWTRELDIFSEIELEKIKLDNSNLVSVLLK